MARGPKVQDTFSRLMAILALVVSVGSYGYDHYQKYAVERNEHEHVLYLVNQLAWNFMPVYVAFTHTSWRSESDMLRDRAGAVKSLQQNADGIAAALHLELNLEDFLPLKGGAKNMGINDTMFYESPMEVITERINDIHDQTAVLVFSLTALNALMLYESGALSLEPNNDALAKPYFAEFDHNVGNINADALKLGIRIIIRSEARDFRSMASQFKSMQDALALKYSDYKDIPQT